jgi:hypothetical protein
MVSNKLPYLPTSTLSTNWPPMGTTLAPTGLWMHSTRPTKLCLCIDDFGVKYFSADNANHLLSTLKAYYKISIDWEGKKYCGFSIKWNYAKLYVNVSMPGYVVTTLECLQHKIPHGHSLHHTSGHNRHTARRSKWLLLMIVQNWMLQTPNTYNLVLAHYSIMLKLSILQCCQPPTRSVANNQPHHQYHEGMSHAHGLRFHISNCDPSISCQQHGASHRL